MRMIREPRSDSPKFMETCFLCKQEFQYGEHVYRGQPVKSWSIIVCTSCLRLNHDGIVEAHHPDLVKHLNSRGIPLKYNEEGHIEWPKNDGLRF